MLKEDMSLRRLMKPQPSQVDCQMVHDPRRSIYYRHGAPPCGRRAVHVVIVDAGCWRAVCLEHAVLQANLHKPGMSFEIEYIEAECQHDEVRLVPSDHPGFDEEWECVACDRRF